MAKRSLQISGSGDHVLWSFYWELCLSVNYLNNTVLNVKEIHVLIFPLCIKIFPLLVVQIQLLGLKNISVSGFLLSSRLLHSHTRGNTVGAVSPRHRCCTTHCPLHLLCPPLPRTPAAWKPPGQIAHHAPALPTLFRDSHSPLQGYLKLLMNRKCLKEQLVILDTGCVDTVLDNNWLYLFMTTFGELSPFLLLGLLAPFGKKKKKKKLSAVLPPLKNKIQPSCLIEAI